VDTERAAVDLAGAQLHELDRGGRDPAVAQERLDLEETLVGLGCEGGDVESCGHRNLHVSRSGRLMDGTARPDVTASGKNSQPRQLPHALRPPRAVTAPDGSFVQPSYRTHFHAPERWPVSA